MEWPWMAMPRRVVYSVNSTGPSTEPWGTPKGIRVIGESIPSSLICWLLSVKYEENQLSALPENPYQFRSLIKNISWSVVSKAADKSSKVRTVTLPWSISISKLLWIGRSAVSTMLFVRWLMGFDLLLAARCDRILFDTTWKIKDAQLDMFVC